MRKVDFALPFFISEGNKLVGKSIFLVENFSVQCISFTKNVRKYKDILLYFFYIIHYSTEKYIKLGNEKNN